MVSSCVKLGVGNLARNLRNFQLNFRSSKVFIHQFFNVFIKASTPLQTDVAYTSLSQSSSRRQKCCQTIILSPWFYISAVGLITALVVGAYLYSQATLKPIDIARLEVEKCPACFGQSACPAFFRGDVRLATFYGSRPIHASDFDKLDDLLDVDLGLFLFCFVYYQCYR